MRAWSRAVAALWLLVGLGVESVAQAPLCGRKSYCSDMATCAEAHYYLTVCNLSDLDRDGDGIPCETICGKTKATMLNRLAAQPFSRVAVPEEQPTGAATLAAPQVRTAKAATTAGAPAETAFQCSTSKRTCGDMSSCEEAKFHLTQCGLKRLDGDGDGVPCNSLCKR